MTVEADNGRVTKPVLKVEPDNGRVAKLIRTLILRDDDGE